MAFTVMGIIVLAVVISLAMLLRRSPAQMGNPARQANPGNDAEELTGSKDSSQPKEFSLKQAFRTKSFWLIMAFFLLFSSSLLLVVTHVVPYATDLGISAMEASTILSIMAGLQIVARLGVGRLLDLKGRKVPGIICAILGAGALLSLAWTQELWMFYLFAVVFGISWGGLAVTGLTIVSDIFRGYSFGKIMGVLEVGFVGGSALGSAIGGLIFDVTGNYMVAFFIGAAAMLLAAFIIALASRER